MCNCSIYGLCSLWTMCPVYFVHPMFYILFYVNIVKAVQTDIYVDCKSIYCIPYMGIIFYKGWCLCPLILLVIFYLGPCEIRCIFMLTRIHQSWYGDGAGAGEYPYHPHPHHPLPSTTHYPLLPPTTPTYTIIPLNLCIHWLIGLKANEPI